MGTIGMGQFLGLGAGRSCGRSCPSGLMAQMLLQGIMQMMMQLMMQTLSQSMAGGCFSPGTNPAFGSCGGSPFDSYGGSPLDGCRPATSQHGFNPCRDFLGGGCSQNHANSGTAPGLPGPERLPGSSPISGAYATQTVGGRASMKEGVLQLKDPRTGEVLGNYQFRNGGHGRGAIPYGEYEVSNGRRRSDVSSMAVGGYGYSFDLTQKGQASGCADDPRYRDQRELLRIHPDGGSAGTMGCIGIVGGPEVQRDFFTKAKALQDKYGGKFSLSFQEATSENQGAASPDQQAAASEIGQWARQLPAPLRQHAGSFALHGEKYGVDPRFLAAISMLETGNGTSRAFRNKNNAMGVSNSRGPIAFASVDASIERMARVLSRPDGPYAGRHTINQIASVYCPVGAGNDVNGTNHHWPRMVSRFYASLGGDPGAAVM